MCFWKHQNIWKNTWIIHSEYQATIMGQYHNDSEKNSRNISFARNQSKGQPKNESKESMVDNYSIISENRPE